MSSTPPGSADTPDVLLRDIRHRLIDRIWLGMLVIAVVGTPASVVRAVSTGWLDVYTFHILVAVTVVSVYCLRARLSHGARSALLLTIFYAIGAVGIVKLGLLGAGLWWLVMSSLLASTLYSHRVGVAISASSLAIVAVAGYGYTTGHLALPVDANAYATSATGWISFLVAASIMPFVVFQAITLFQKSTLELLGEIHRQRAEIQILATHDQLTGLPLLDLARDRLQMALHEAVRTGNKVALLFIDLDGFKEVNDGHGHEAGDLVLKTVSSRILTCMREVDTAARIGGDEFILVLGNLHDKGEAALVAERVIDGICQPIAIAGGEARIGASIGVALFPDDATDAIALRRAADEAMYAVKRTGKNAFAFATPAGTGRN